jgi:cysteine sulfinate desulfinase/cysteine desulfurase-like protein
MGIPSDQLRASVRFSLGATTTVAEIDEAIARVVGAIERMQETGKGISSPAEPYEP